MWTRLSAVATIKCIIILKFILHFHYTFAFGRHACHSWCSGASQCVCECHSVYAMCKCLIRFFFFTLHYYHLFFALPSTDFNSMCVGKWKGDWNRGKGIKANQVIWMVVERRNIWYMVWLCICGVSTDGAMPLYAKLNCALHSQLARILFAGIGIHARTTRYAVGLADKRDRATKKKKKVYDKLGNKVDWLAEQKSFIWRSFRLPAPLPPSSSRPCESRSLTRQFIIRNFTFYQMEKFFFSAHFTCR